MNLLEAPICAKAVARLRSKGWRVGCEIRTDNRPIDAAAILNGKVLALEAKVSLNEKLRHQLNWCVKHKIGLWIVTDRPIIELVPYRQRTPNNNYRNDIIRRLERWNETIVGGVPNRLGIGVAQDVQRRVNEYRAANPNATWKEIHSSVPSHYDSYKNMYSSLRSNAERLAWRKRLLGRAKKISETLQHAQNKRSILAADK